MPSTLPTPKQATNISLSTDVLNEAKALGIHLSQACEQFLRDLREHRWLADNVEFIAAYNRSVEIEGFS